MNNFGKVKLLILLLVFGIISFFIIDSLAQGGEVEPTPGNGICEEGLGEVFDRAAFLSGAAQDCWQCNNDGICNDESALVDYGEDIYPGCADCEVGSGCSSNSDCGDGKACTDDICTAGGTCINTPNCPGNQVCNAVGICADITSPDDWGDCFIGVSETDLRPFFPEGGINVGPSTEDECLADYNNYIVSGAYECGRVVSGGIEVKVRQLIWNDEKLLDYYVCPNFCGPAEPTGTLCKKEDLRTRWGNCRDINAASVGGSFNSQCPDGEFMRQAFFNFDDNGLITGITASCCTIEVFC